MIRRRKQKTYRSSEMTIQMRPPMWMAAIIKRKMVHFCCTVRSNRRIFLTKTAGFTQSEKTVTPLGPWFSWLKKKYFFFLFQKSVARTTISKERLLKKYSWFLNESQIFDKKCQKCASEERTLGRSIFLMI